MEDDNKTNLEKFVNYISQKHNLNESILIDNLKKDINNFWNILFQLINKKSELINSGSVKDIEFNDNNIVDNVVFNKDFNKKELEKEIDILSNEVDKMHYIFDLGLELAPLVRKVTLDKLMEKAKSAPAIALKKINAQIEEIKNFPIIDFLNSTYGKVLKDALAKKGLSDTLLIGFKKQLMKSRGERRKAEKIEFKIEVNVFDGEDITQLKLNLMDLIQQEYKDINKNFKGYIRDKIVESMFSK